MSDQTIGGLQVRVGRNGGADITVLDRGDSVGIAPEERIALALALLGSGSRTSWWSGAPKPATKR